MHIVTLADATDHVSVRYRIDPLRAALHREGHWFEVAALPKSLLGRLSLFRQLRNADVVILQRCLLSQYEVKTLRYYARRLVYDFDDAVFRRDSFHGKQESPKRMARFRYTLSQADRVIAGNAFLARAARPFVSSPEQIRIISTTLDVERYQAAVHTRRGAGVRLVWIGTSSTLRGLEREQRLWEAIGRRLPGIELHVICDRFPEFRDIPLVPVRWGSSTEMWHLGQADIGLAFMPDDDWSRGKCGLKVLQYMAAGLPVVANPVGVHREMVQPGFTGFLAGSPEEWIEHLGKLMHDPQLRGELGAQGRKQAEYFYSNRQLVELWKPLLGQLLPAETIVAAAS